MANVRAYYEVSVYEIWSKCYADCVVGEMLLAESVCCYVYG